MKRRMKKGLTGVLILLGVLLFGMTVQAEEGDTLKTGIFAGDIELSGMTSEEASAAVESYVEGLREVEITLLSAEGQELSATAGEMGVFWSNSACGRGYGNRNHRQCDRALQDFKGLRARK